MTITTAEADTILADHFAPWVQALELSVTETGDRHAVLRLPWSDELAREGGGLSGQALMVVAVSAARGGFGPMTTIQQSTTFQRAVVGADVLVTARITKLGRRLAFVDVVMTAEGEEEPAAHASTVYAFPG
ncbi:PaaI family thioesterase [Kitasatospora arboriphila]|uniref:PaaI family thioesterase n=1 Tax=Kitasatospora arboriphila TaxID=258052 RepID=A0ABP4EV20_9ACTN